ncbi:MAG: glycosyltransferase [candidate division WOR-3 bacterium]
MGYTRFLHREATSLAAAGYQVTLIGLHDTNPLPQELPVKIVPVPVQRLGRKPGLVRTVVQIASTEQAQVYHCVDPWALSVGLSFKRRNPSVKLVYEATEWFARAQMERPDLPLPLRWLACRWVERLEHRAKLDADAIIDTNATRARRFNNARCPVVLVPNYPRREDLPAPVEEREPCLAYTGLISRHRGFDVLLRALAAVMHTHPELKLRVAGGFDPRDSLEAWTQWFAEENRLSPNLELLGWLPYAEMFRAVSSCMAGVILLQGTRTNDYTGQPNKLFEFMGAGLPVICSDFPEMGTIVRRHQCGWLVNPADVMAVATAISELLADPAAATARGLAARAAVLTNYTWDVAEKELLNLYQQLLPIT